MYTSITGIITHKNMPNTCNYSIKTKLLDKIIVINRYPHRPNHVNNPPYTEISRHPWGNISSDLKLIFDNLYG